MVKMRAALESDYVTLNIHKWIDLIFGFKQTGEAALASDNMFYPYTYEENVRWDKCRTLLEK
jgi:factor associated with neutral sphingomyelinase activation